MCRPHRSSAAAASSRTYYTASIGSGADIVVRYSLFAVGLTPEGSVDQDLVEAARGAAEHASAPYSHFRVGAAAETADGRVFLGCNVESPAYPLTLCAERVAIFSAIASGAKPRRIAVSCRQGNPQDPDSLMPCGACRQVILDQLGPDAEVTVDGVGTFTAAELLPRGFHLP